MFTVHDLELMYSKRERLLLCLIIKHTLLDLGETQVKLGIPTKVEKIKVFEQIKQHCLIEVNLY